MAPLCAEVWIFKSKPIIKMMLVMEEHVPADVVQPLDAQPLPDVDAVIERVALPHHRLQLCLHVVHLDVHHVLAHLLADRNCWMESALNCTRIRCILRWLMMPSTHRIFSSNPDRCWMSKAAMFSE